MLSGFEIEEIISSFKGSHDKNITTLNSLLQLKNIKSKLLKSTNDEKLIQEVDLLLNQSWDPSQF